MRLFESNRGSVSPSISHQIYHINSISFHHNFLSFQAYFPSSFLDIIHLLCYTIDVEIQLLIRTRRHRIMIIDMEKYRHGHCRGGRGAAQGIATAAAANGPAASVLEPISFPGEVANVLKLNLRRSHFRGAVSRGAPAESMISPTIPRDAPTPLPTFSVTGSAGNLAGRAANTAPAMR